MRLRAAYFAMHRHSNRHFLQFETTADQYVLLSYLAEEEGIHTAGVVDAVFVGRADHRDDDRAAAAQWSGRASAAPVRPPRLAGISDRYRTGTSRATQEELRRRSVMSSTACWSLKNWRLYRRHSIALPRRLESFIESCARVSSLTQRREGAKSSIPTFASSRLCVRPCFVAAAGRAGDRATPVTPRVTSVLNNLGTYYERNPYHVSTQ